MAKYKIIFYTKNNEQRSIKAESKEVADRITKEMINSGLKVVDVYKIKKG